MKKLTVYQHEKNKYISESNILHAFPFINEKGHVISLVGGGGKTSLMTAFAEQYAMLGMRTLVTTTTHIGIPEDGSYVTTLSEMEMRWADGKYATTGHSENEHKLSMLPKEKLKRYMGLADVTLIEADGAKRLPCKVPRAREPVILPECDIVVGVMGLDTLGKTCEEVCFCLDEVETLLGKKRSEIMTVEDMVKILTSEKGTKKGVGERQYYIVLNKCDVINISEDGDKLLKELEKYGEMRGRLTTFQEGAHVER